MTFRIPILWLITAAVSVAATLTFAIAFYPRGATEEEKYAVAAQRKKAYDTIGQGTQEYSAGKIDAAVAKYREALTIDPKVSSAYYLIGTTELNDDKLNEAVAQFDQALAFDKYPEHIYNNRGVARMRLGDTKGALSDFDEALALRPSMLRPRINRGLLRLQQGDAAAAVQDLDSVIAACATPADGIVAYVGRGIARAKLGDLAGAEADLSLAREWAEGKERVLNILRNRAALRELKGDGVGAQVDRAEYERLKELPETSKEFVRPLKGAGDPTNGRDGQR